MLYSIYDFDREHDGYARLYLKDKKPLACMKACEYLIDRLNYRLNNYEISSNEYNRKKEKIDKKYSYFENKYNEIEKCR